MKHLLILILILAYVTNYGRTGYKMANGQYPFIGAAACPRNIKLESRIRIAGLGDYVCGDRTSRKYNGRFDIFSTGTQKEMMQFGKKLLDVKVL